MPPSVKIAKEDIIKTAVDIIKEEGVNALNARNIAARLNCSTQPIFSNFNNMQDLKDAVIDYANSLYQGFLDYDMHKGKYPMYKASGMAYIRFAREEKALFKLLFMRDRTDENVTDDGETLNLILSIIMQNLNISQEAALKLHLNMWIYVHGIATMIATDYLDWNAEFVSNALSDTYRALMPQL